MIDLYLVRHGEAAASWSKSADPGLSALGHEQAMEVAATLAAKIAPPVEIISSPLLRARETAQPFCMSLGTEAIIDQAFHEIPSPVPLEQRQQWLLKTMKESWQQQDAAVIAWRDELLGKVTNIQQHTVIFTHFMVINAIVGSIDDSLNIVCCMPDNTSVTHIRAHEGSLQLISLGHEIRTDVV